MELLYIAECLKIPVAEVPVNWKEVDGKSVCVSCSFLLFILFFYFFESAIVSCQKKITKRLDKTLNKLRFQEMYLPYMPKIIISRKKKGGREKKEKERKRKARRRKTTTITRSRRTRRKRKRKTSSILQTSQC